MMRIYYFGVTDGTGHHLIDEDGMLVKLSQREAFPFDWRIIDSMLLDRKKRLKTGAASIVYLNTWTIFSFWDLTGDSRPNSNSAFIADAILTIPDLLDSAKHRFPSFFKRFEPNSFDFDPEVTMMVNAYQKKLPFAPAES